MSSEYTQWLERNGGAPCGCGHPYRRHLADLSGCADCNNYEPVHIRCEGFDLARLTPGRQPMSDGKCLECGKGIGHFMDCSEHPDFGTVEFLWNVLQNPRHLRRPQTGRHAAPVVDPSCAGDQ